MRQVYDELFVQGDAWNLHDKVRGRDLPDLMGGAGHARTSDMPNPPPCWLLDCDVLMCIH